MGITGIDSLYSDPVEGTPSMADTENYDDADVKAALERQTSDGSGFDDPIELPESDFTGFTGFTETSDLQVENNHDGDNEPAVEENDK